MSIIKNNLKLIAIIMLGFIIFVTVISVFSNVNATDNITDINMPNFFDKLRNFILQILTKVFAAFYKIGSPLNHSNLEMAVGDEETLKFVVQTNGKITWTSDNTEVAIVDNKGKVTAIGAGEAYINGKSSTGIDATCKVIVKEIISNPPFIFSGRNKEYYNLDDDEIKIFAAVLMGEVPASDEKRVFWCSSVLFNRIDTKFYGDTDAMKILTRGWSEVYNNGSYKKNLDKIPDNVMDILKEVINGKRAHKYRDFGCGQEEINRVKNSGEKYEIIAEDIYYDWIDGLQ